MRPLTVLCFYLGFAFLAAAIMSCDKDENPQFNEELCESECYTIQGRILEGQTGEPIKGAEVRASKRYNSWNTDLLLTTNSGNNGDFEVSIPSSYFIANETNPSYRIEIFQQGYLNEPHRETFFFDSTEIDIPILKDFILYHYSYIKVHLYDNPNTDFGWVSVGVNWELEDIMFSGQSSNDFPEMETEMTFKVPSDVPSVLEWENHDGEIDVSGSTKFIVPRDSILEFDIHL